MFNSLRQAISTEFVGRNSAGVPTAGQSLGSLATEWGTLRCQNAIINGDALDVSQVTAPQNRVIAGKTRTSSNQPAFITPNGAALSLVIDATPTALEVDVNGANVTVSADITISGLTGAPGTNTTALINDTDAAGQADTRLWGEPEHRKSIIMDTVGSNISALVGKYAAFKLNSEYFLAYVKSASELTQCRRGYYYDSSLNPVNRGVFSNNDTLTLQKLGWIFLENNGTTTDVTYNNPVWSFTSPGSPVTGDYWYDLANNVWKRYDGAAFQIINRVLIGTFINSNTACVGARCIDFFAKYEDTNTMALSKFSTEIVKGSKLNQKVRVAGHTFDFGNSLVSWNITTDLAGADDMYSATEQASTMYYLYVTDVGDTVISDISPYFRSDLFGEYHPHNPWRCVGLAYNDASSDISVVSSVGFPELDHLRVSGGNGGGSTATQSRRFIAATINKSASVLYIDSATDGSAFRIYWPGSYGFSYQDSNAAGSRIFGIDLNPSAAALTGQPADADCLVSALALNASTPVGMSTVASLKLGDVVRAHSEGSPGETSFAVNFTASRIA
jgi:hypothetical protein